MAGSTPLPGTSVRGSRRGRPIMALLDLLGRRWALRVLWELRDDPLPTFRALQESCGHISSSVLSSRVAELTDAGLVEHTGEGYRLTRQGRSLLVQLGGLDAWAKQWTPS